MPQRRVLPKHPTATSAGIELLERLGGTYTLFSCAMISNREIRDVTTWADTYQGSRGDDLLGLVPAMKVPLRGLISHRFLDVFAEVEDRQERHALGAIFQRTVF